MFPIRYGAKAAAYNFVAWSSGHGILPFSAGLKPPPTGHGMFPMRCGAKAAAYRLWNVSNTLRG
ncbi:hypothetical protein Q4574_20770 [Aliiglaciecola sp. 3_MG-2023]|uniref:hypothetical protein n=1 Tax=Aliiglaciecola sp. 3_MG-2023 TaxID=3062644 RepID=UPI0026E27F7C|nr:hypothetical protein [Aliiglaciecola sp. 3_MG-2023]MDO6695744.1 hypothetical protein [Aliiglaciecola sp. 3_MG-2023]